jgi:tRNA(fMet)-specific endonuclease VapC
VRVLLDTSVAIALRDGDPGVIRRAAPIDPVAIISILTVVELEGGVVATGIGQVQRRATVDGMYANLDILPFGQPEAAAYRIIIEALGFSRPRIIDRMIAATAIVADARLATLNVRDFRAIPGLNVEDWSI